MSAQIDFLKRCKELGLHNGKLSNWLDEIESLRAQIAELEAKNERLRMALADTEALEIGTAERCAKLTCQRDEAVQMLADWCDEVRDNGTGWDDWDKHYEYAAWRQCGIRELIDAARTTEGATE